MTTRDDSSHVDSTDSELSAGDADLEYDLADGEAPSRAVSAVVAALTDRSELELSPLAETIDSEALDRLFSSAGDGTRPVVRFEYEGCELTAYPDGRIAATDLSPE